MNSLTRREFVAATGAAALMPQPARSQIAARVVVIGGGVGGATVAKYLAASAPRIEVTLVEPKLRYTTCFFSNLYLAGLRSLESLTHGYDTLAQKYGVKVIHDSATSIDPVSKTVTLASGTTLPYDRLVVSPGIAFKYDSIVGYDEAATQFMPHAWSAGPQTQLLRNQLESMEQGGVFAITAPVDPFRCPPGPYERASLVASYFKTYNPRAKILILDEKDSFFEQDLFQDGWSRHYPGMIEWLPGQFTGGVKAVNVKDLSIRTANETFRASVANIIPPQRAGRLAQQTGLANASGWCPVDPATFESKLHPAIHVVGDASDAGSMPKSAFVANAQAKACAYSIAAALTGAARAAPHLFNTCYTFVSDNDAWSDAISFAPAGDTIKVAEILISNIDENAETRRVGARRAEGWYDAFTHDVFG